MSGPSIEALHLGRRFGSFEAVSDVSFAIERGEIFGYLGANGAGKSTTIRMLCGLLEPTSGRGRVAGYDVAQDPESVKKSIGYMSQKFSLYLDLSVIDNLLFFGGAYGLERRALRERAEEILALTDLGQSRAALTGSLPGGVRQRLALGCAILHRPEVVFLDEPTSGVDPAVRRSFWRLIRELAHGGTTIFVTTHYLDEAEYCARIGLMVDGKLVALDTPAALKRDYVPELVLSVRGANLSSAGAALARQKGIRAVEPFGAGLHVRADRATWDMPSLAVAIEQAGASQVTVEISEPSLEDVFLAVVGRSENGSQSKEKTA